MPMRLLERFRCGVPAVVLLACDASSWGEGSLSDCRAERCSARDPRRRRSPSAEWVVACSRARVLAQSPTLAGRL